jgi:hypothetical protein
MYKKRRARPGPREVDLGSLKTCAELWRQQLLMLRDGEAGALFRLRGREKPVPVATILPADNKAQTMRALEDLRNLRGKPGILWMRSPIPREPELWQKLKRAEHSDNIHEFLVGLENWRARQFPQRWASKKKGDVFLTVQASTKKPANRLSKHERRFGPTWSRLIIAAREHAGDILAAKNLPHYPRKDRPSSDNKRIEFLAKVLSGIALRLAPATATKRLSRWRPGMPAVSRDPLPATGPNCPHCGMEEVPGFPPETVVRCPGCDERYNIAPKMTAESKHEA